VTIIGIEFPAKCTFEEAERSADHRETP